MVSAPISRESLATSRVLFDEIDRNSISLAKMLVGWGAQVRIVDPHPIPSDLLDDCRQLEKSGVLIQEESDPNTLTLDYDILFVALLNSPNSPYIVEARRRGKLVSNLADLIFQLSPVPKVGVTGSAGKSSTSTILSQMIVTSGQRTYISQGTVGEHLWPNYSLLNQLHEMHSPAWLVVELTSGHLEYMHTSPDIAVVTNLSPDHVEWHGSLEAYLRAKETILRYQSSQQWAILNRDDELSQQRFAPQCQGQVAYFSLTHEVDRGVFLKGDQIISRWNEDTQIIASVNEVQLSQRYLANVLAACTAARAAGASIGAINQVIRNFKGLAQRLTFVDEVAGIRFFNDGRAGTPQKAIASFESFPDYSLILLAGGQRTSRHDPQGMHNRDEEIIQLKATCRLAGKKAKAIVLFDEATPLLQEYLAVEGYSASKIQVADSIHSAFRKAVCLAAAGDIILLAPIFGLSWAEGTAFDTMVLDYAKEVTTC